jgi:hypothetical protein
MMPGGHLATSVGLAAVGYAATGSMEFAAGCFTGGFLIDADHYLDYLVFEGQWRRPDPASFLRYYFTDQAKRVVLPLHSAELMTILTLAAFLWPVKFLVGYLLGAALHLACDIAVNGDYVIRHPFLFYIFTYRASAGFLTRNLLEPSPLKPGTGSKPFREFFGWRPPQLGGKRRLEAKTSEWVSRIYRALPGSAKEDSNQP